MTVTSLVTNLLRAGRLLDDLATVAIVLVNLLLTLRVFAAGLARPTRPQPAVDEPVRFLGRSWLKSSTPREATTATTSTTPIEPSDFHRPFCSGLIGAPGPMSTVVTNPIACIAPPHIQRPAGVLP